MTVAPESYEPLDFSTCGLEVESHISGAHMSPRQSTHSASSRHSGYPVDRVSGQERVRHTAVHAMTSSSVVVDPGIKVLAACATIALLV